MLAFPVHPRYARMLLAAQEYGCVYQACLVAALTQGRDLLLRNVGPRHRSGSAKTCLGDQAASRFLDPDARLELRGARTTSASRPAAGWASTRSPPGRSARCSSSSSTSPSAKGWTSPSRDVPDEALQKCILIGFCDRVARRLDRGHAALRTGAWPARGAGAGKRRAATARCSSRPKCARSKARTRPSNTLLSLATAIEAEWLREFFPEDMQARAARLLRRRPRRRVCAEEQVRFRDLALSTRRVEPPPADAAARLLAEEVMAGPADAQELGPRRRPVDPAAEPAEPAGARSWSCRRSPTRTAATWSSSFATARSPTRTSRTAR